MGKEAKGRQKRGANSRRELKREEGGGGGGGGGGAGIKSPAKFEVRSIPAISSSSSSCRRNQTREITEERFNLLERETMEIGNECINEKSSDHRKATRAQQT